MKREGNVPVIDKQQAHSNMFKIDVRLCLKRNIILTLNKECLKIGERYEYVTRLITKS